MTRPLGSPPTWATDDDFASGDESGDSTRLEPSSGVKAQGMLPNARLAARYGNWLFGSTTDWLDYAQRLLDTMKARNWKREAVDFNPSDQYSLVGGLWVTSQNFSSAGRWYLFGDTGAGAGAIVIMPAVNPAAPAIATGLEVVLTMAANGDASVILIGGHESSGANTVVKKSTNLGETFTEKVVDNSANNNIDFLRYEPGSDKFIALRQNQYDVTDFIWNSEDGGETWTDVSGAFPSWIHSIAGTPSVMEAANGTVIVGGNMPTLVYSHDGGDTWTETATLPGGITNVYGLAYSQSRGMWRALGLNGTTCRILKSLDDGATWSLDGGVISKITSSTQLVFTTANGALSCDGEALWVIGYNKEAGGSDPVATEHGVIYFGDDVSADFVLLHSDYAASPGYKPKFLAFGQDHFGLYGESDVGGSNKSVWYTSLKMQG